MAFRLSRRHSIPVQLGRIARREIDAALDELDRRALDRRAIHEARKSVKKVRAVLRLLRDALGLFIKILIDAKHAFGLVHQVDTSAD